jgi:hypothetical protein
MKSGSARFLNHNQHPNCRSKVVHFRSHQIILFSVVRNIEQHEETDANQTDLAPNPGLARKITVYLFASLGEFDNLVLSTQK